MSVSSIVTVWTQVDVSEGVNFSMAELSIENVLSMADLTIAKNFAMDRLVQDATTWTPA